MTPSCVPRAVSVGEFMASELRVVAGIERLGEPEVEHLDGAIGANLDVGRLQIAVDDALFVRASSASAICRAIGSASSSGMAPCAIRSASVGPRRVRAPSAWTPDALRGRRCGRCAGD